jgi:hypothetical protein
MRFQKDLPPPGMYDGACAIVKRNPSPCIWKALRLISAEERHQQTCNLGCDHRTAQLQGFRSEFFAVETGVTFRRIRVLLPGEGLLVMRPQHRVNGCETLPSRLHC